MLYDIVKNALRTIQSDSESIENLSHQCVSDIKYIAKKMFFEQKINDLKDFIFDFPNPHNEQTKKRFLEDIGLDNPYHFIQEVKNSIQKEIEAKGLEKNLHSLLDILDYGHLKDFLKMFKL